MLPVQAKPRPALPLPISEAGGLNFSTGLAILQEQVLA